MPEKSQKRKLRSDQSTSQLDVKIASSVNDEIVLLSDRDFEDVSNKIENKFSKRLKETELNQCEILRLIGSLSSKVGNLSSAASEQGCLTTRTENSGNPTEELEEVDSVRNVNSNMVTGVNNEPNTSNNTHSDRRACHFQTRGIQMKLLTNYWNLSTQHINKHQTYLAYQKP